MEKLALLKSEKMGDYVLTDVPLFDTYEELKAYENDEN